MSVELIRDLCRVERATAENSVQVMVNDSRELPEGSPLLDRIDADSILHSEARAQVDQCKIFDDRVVVAGHLDLEIIYSAEGEEETPICRGEIRGINFEGAVDIEGEYDRDSLRAVADVMIEELDLLPKSKTLLDIDAVLEITVRLYEDQEVNVVVGVRGIRDEDVSFERESLRIEECIGEGRTDFSVKGTRTLREGLPPFRCTDTASIIDKRAKVKIGDTRVLDCRVAVEGSICLGLIYMAEEGSCDPDHPIRYVEFQDIDFEEYIEVEGAEPGHRVSVVPCIEKIDLKVIAGNVVQYEICIVLSAKVFDEREIDVITDIESQTDDVVDLERIKVELKCLVGVGRSQYVTRGEADLPHGRPRIYNNDDFTILGISSRVRSVDCRVKEDKVIVEGVADICVAYAPDLEYSALDQPICFQWFKNIEFDCIVDLHGAMPGMLCEAVVNIEDFEIDPTDSCDGIEYALVFEACVKLYEFKELDIILNAELVPPVKRCPEIITFYIVQPGDTLWKIARRYGVTVNSIVQANNIENPDLIYPGQRLIIPSTVRLG